MPLTDALNRYRSSSEDVYQAWVSGATIDNPIMRNIFDLEYMPEPYLDFGDGEDFCVFLTTNPGGGMPVQLRDGISLLCPQGLPASYQEMSRLLANYYSGSGELKGAALGNIRAMRGLAEAFGYKRVLQVEGFPWHSADLPGKVRLRDQLTRLPEYSSYYQALCELIAKCPLVLSWSAGRPEVRGGDGQLFKAEIMGMDLQQASMISISLSKKHQVSQALAWQADADIIRGLFVRTGSAGLPKNVVGARGDLYGAIVTHVRQATGIGTPLDLTDFEKRRSD